ncbi:MAG: AsmA-like C-terminal region-containing protein, partial [Candidatus Methylomirabilis sp.]|nr:AsmA-like C-terminal region-containing protein [Deltaproteobacteria bacterium]
PITGAAHFTPQTLTLRGVKTTYVGHPITLAADVTAFKPLKASFNVDAPFLNLDLLIERFRSDLPEEEAEPAAEDLARYEGIELSGALHSARIELGDVTFTDFDSHFLLEDGVLRIPEFEFDSLEGSFRGDGVFERFFERDARTLALTTKIQGLDVTELSKALGFENDSVTGRVDAVSRLKGKARDWPAFRDSLEGGLSFHMSNGAIKGFPILSRILDLLALNVGGLVTGAMEYDAIDGDFVFRSGTGSTRNFLVDSKTMKIRAAGDVILPSQSVDLLIEAQPLSRLDMALGAIPLVGSILTGPDASRGLVAVYFTAKGPVEDPEVKTASVDSLLVSPWRGARDWMFQLLAPEK